MKRDLYFTPETIDAKSESMIGEVASLQIAQRRSNLATGGDTALLVLDMQNYFLREDSHAFVPSALAIIPNIQKLIDVFRRRNQLVAFTRHVNAESNAGMMSRWWRDLLRDDDERSSLVPDLNAIVLKNHFPIVAKTQYDAFYQTTLDDILKSRNIARVAITGVMTHLCCETTARSAFMHGYEVWFVVDGTATYTEAFHRASLLNLAHGFANIVSSKELIER